VTEKLYNISTHTHTHTHTCSAIVGLLVRLNLSNMQDFVVTVARWIEGD